MKNHVQQRKVYHFSGNLTLLCEKVFGMGGVLHFEFLVEETGRKF